MPEKDDKPKRGRKPVAASPAAKSAPASSSDKKPMGKKPLPLKKVEPIKDATEDDKASKIAQALFGDESAASADRPAPANTNNGGDTASAGSNNAANAGQGTASNNGPNFPAQRYPQPKKEPVFNVEFDGVIAVSYTHLTLPTKRIV